VRTAAVSKTGNVMAGAVRGDQPVEDGPVRWGVGHVAGLGPRPDQRWIDASSFCSTASFKVWFRWRVRSVRPVAGVDADWK
jgi:hypothetical protein